MADVGGPRDRRSPKGQGLLRKEGPPTYAILSQNLVLSQFTRFMHGHHRAFYKSHPTLGVLSTKVSYVSLLLKPSNKSQPAFGELLESLLSKSFRRVFREFSENFQRAFGELPESFRRAFVELS